MQWKNIPDRGNSVCSGPAYKRESWSLCSDVICSGRPTLNVLFSTLVLQCLELWSPLPCSIFLLQHLILFNVLCHWLMFIGFVPFHLPHAPTPKQRKKMWVPQEQRFFFSFWLFTDVSQMSVIMSGVGELLTICWLDDWTAGDEAGTIDWWLVVKIIVGLGKERGITECHRLQGW